MLQDVTSLVVTIIPKSSTSVLITFSHPNLKNKQNEIGTGNVDASLRALKAQISLATNRMLDYEERYSPS